MKRAWIVICCACAALALVPGAAAKVSFGITEDTGALSDPDSFYTTLSDLGVTENRIGILWNPAQPYAIQDQADLDYWIPSAAIHGIRIILAVSPAHPRDVTGSPAAIAQFAAFMQQLARTYPADSEGWDRVALFPLIVVLAVVGSRRSWFNYAWLAFSIVLSVAFMVREAVGYWVT